MANELIPLEGPKVVAQPTNPFMYQEARTIMPEPKVAVGQGIDLGAIGKAAAELGTQYVQMKHEQFAAEKQDAIDQLTSVTQSKLAHYSKLNDVEGYTNTLNSYQDSVSKVMGLDPKSKEAPAGLVWQRMWSGTRAAIGKFEADREFLLTGVQEDKSVAALRTIASQYDFDMANAKTVTEAEKITKRYQEALVTINKTELQGTDDVFAADDVTRSPNQFQRKALIQSEYAKAQAQLQKAVAGQKGFDPKSIWDRGQAQLHAAHSYLDLAEKQNQAVVDLAKQGIEVPMAQITASSANIVKLKTASIAAIKQVYDALHASGVLSKDQYDELTSEKGMGTWLTPEGVATLQAFGADDPFIEKINKTVVFLESEKPEQVQRTVETMTAVMKNTEKARNEAFEGLTSQATSAIVELETRYKKGEIQLSDAQAKASQLAIQHRSESLGKFQERWGALLLSKGVDISKTDFTNLDEVKSVIAQVKTVAPDVVPHMSSEIAKISDQFTRVNEKLQQLYPADSKGTGGRTSGVTREQGGRQLLNAAQTGSTTVTKDDFANASYAVDAAFKDMGFTVSVEPNSLPVAAQMYDFLKKNPDKATKLPYDLLMSSEYGPALMQAALAEYNRTATVTTTESREEFFGKFLKRFAGGSGDNPIGWGDMHRQEGVSFAIDLPEKTSDAFIDMLREPSNDQATMTAAMALSTPKWREGLAARVHAEANNNPKS